MYSAQHTMMAYITAMKRKYAVSHVLRGEDNAPFRNDQKTSFIRTWSNFLSGNYLSSMWPANNPLSVTIVNNEILNSDLSEYSSTTNKELSYILQEKKLLDLKQGNPEKYMKDMVDVSILEQASKNHLQDWPCNNVDDPNLIKNRNYVNLIKNSGDTYEDNSTMESHSMLHVNETEKTTEDNITVFGPSDVDSQKREIGIHEDMDVESFLVVSHSDVPAIHAGFVRENPMSRLSNVWRNTWNNLTSRVYCKTESADPGMSVKRPSCSTKQHRRRKANAIAIGRGRGRARCQLRRSGVSQTVCRKEYTQYDGYEVCPNDLVDSAPNDCPLDSKLGNLNNIDVPDATQFIKQTNSPAISTSPKTTAKGKSKARKKKKTKAKYMTKVRYIADPSRSDSDYYEDSNSEMHNARKSSFRSRLLSDSSMDSEDCFIVFESNDDELPETCEKQGVTEHPTEARNVPDSSMRTNDSPYKDSDNETCEEKDSFRLRSLSESSTDSTDNFIVFDEQEATECPRMRYDYLTKINDKRREDCNSQTQKNSFQRHRLLSNSSENTDDSFSIVFTDIEENCAIDDVDGDEIEEMSFYEGDSRPEDESISEDGQDNEELIAQSKKVSFDLTPVVHIMVKWNYAYRAARKGNWEEIARDNERFRGRINSIAIVLDPILKSNHRSQVWQKRFAFPEQFWPD